MCYNYVMFCIVHWLKRQQPLHELLSGGKQHAWFVVRVFPVAQMKSEARLEVHKHSVISAQRRVDKPLA